VLASGSIDISSDPAGAEVTVNGVDRGKTPLKVTEVPRGRAMVKFRLAGFAEEVRELAVNSGDELTLPVALKALPGTLHLVSVPEGARFYVNDKAVGKGPVAIPDLVPGDYLVRAELEGFGTSSRTVTLKNGESASEEFKLSNVMGRIELKSNPVGVQVLLDGRPVGVTKAADPKAETSDVFTIENVLEGEHTVTLRKDGYVEVVRHPKVKSEKTAQATIHLRRIFKPDTEIVTSRGNYRGVLVSMTPEYVILEVSLGITQSFARDEIRKMTSITSEP